MSADSPWWTKAWALITLPVALLGMTVVIITALVAMDVMRDDGQFVFGARRITDLAVFIAGRKRSSLREEWRAHLAGDEGRELSPLEKLRAASGFAAAAVRYRLRDVSLVAWKVIDRVLKSRPLSNMFVLSPTVAAAVIILRNDGAAGMLGSAESIAAIGGALYGLICVGRWWRDVKPPEPKARRARE